MGRKPKQETQKQVRVFIVEGREVNVSFFPPKGREKSWHAYWNGLPTRRSTRCADLESAIEFVRKTFTSGRTGDHDLMTDREFDLIQETFHKRNESKTGTIKGCLEAISAFRTVTGIKPITAATAEDCARFQDKALKLPKNWRAPFRDETSRVKKTNDGRLGTITRQTVLKWSTALSAAFNRSCMSSGKKCIRSVVGKEKLLKINPWAEFQWIEDKTVPAVRQFSSKELLSVLEFFRQRFPLVPIAEYAAQMFLWSYARRKEISSLRWDSVRQIGQEVHFDITGKWRVRKWFRIPQKLFTNLLSIRDPENPFVFAAYSKQLRNHHVSQDRQDLAMRVRDDFVPENFGDWFYEQISRWARINGFPEACVHSFRKTALQFAVDGAVINDGVAKDAGVHVEVMKKHYTSETERLLREKSNRTFERISQSLDQQVLVCFGYSADTENHLIEQLKNATFNCDWTEVRKLASQLEKAKGTVA